MSFQKQLFISKNAVSTILFLLSVLLSLRSNASHMAGAELAYEYQGNDQYKFTYTLYTDCSGSLPPLSVNLMLRSSECNLNQMTTLSKVNDSEIEISPNCTSSPSTCNGGTNSGYKQIKYSASLSLALKCSDFIFSVTDCCRNSSITSIANPEMQPLYIEARLNNTTETNSSPIFDSQPLLILSTNQSNQILESAVDADGDSLVYVLIAPKTSELNNVNYVSDYNANQFINTNQPISFDTKSGSMQLVPTQLETVILAVQVNEYRFGRFIGSIMRDIQMISSNSTNHLPTIQQLENRSDTIWRACVGENLTINLSSVDMDAAQGTVIEVTSNIQGLQVTRSSDVLQKAQITWTPDSSIVQNNGLWIKVKVRDNACPMNGIKNYLLNISVSQMTITSTVTASDCTGKNNGSIYTAISGTSTTANFTWSHSNFKNTFCENLPAGIYSVTIDNLEGCVVNKSFQIVNLENLNMLVTTSKASCKTADGHATISISGGTAPYIFNWSDGKDSDVRNELIHGTYTVRITDQIGCEISKSVVIEGVECLERAPTAILFPNPASDRITLQMENFPSPISSISIIDATSKIVYQQNQSIENQLLTVIDLTAFAKGIYLINIISDDSRQIASFIRL